MNDLTRDELRELTQPGSGPCVSIYMPTHQAGAEIQQDLTRFKNLLRAAEERLRMRGMRDPEVARMTASTWELLDARVSWRNPRAGFALFIRADGEVRSYQLPETVDEAVVVNDRPYVRPLIRILSSDVTFYIVSLDLDNARLFRGSHFDIVEVTPTRMPGAIDEALHYDETEQQMQMHTAIAGTGLPGWYAKSAFHAKGGHEAENFKRDDVLEFYRLVDRGVHEIIAGTEAPLVLAGVESRFPIYRDANSHPKLMEYGVAGNPTLMTLQELHDRAWNIVAPYFQTEEHRMVAQFANLSGTGKATSDTRDILAGVEQGRVNALFVPATGFQWGAYDTATDDFELLDEHDARAEDLMDRAAVRGLENGARVYVVADEAVPGDGQMAAVMRY